MGALLLFVACENSPCDPPSYTAPCHNWNCELDGLVCHDEDQACVAECLTDADCEQWAGRGEEFVCSDGLCSGPFCSGNVYPMDSR